MIYKIIGTTFSKGLIAIIGLLTLILNTRNLGAEKMGQLAIYLIIIALLLQLSEFVGGSSIVFLQKKYTIKQIVTVSYLWSLLIGIISSICLCLLKHAFNLPVLLIISAFFIQALNHIHLHLLIGKKRIKEYNISTLLNSISLLIGLFFFYQIQKSTEVNTYLTIFIFSQLIMLFASGWFVFQIKETNGFTSNKLLIKEIFNYGLVIQAGNLFQFGVYRLNYLILEAFTFASNLGIYSVGNQLNEKVLIPGKSISMVQYTYIANSSEQKEAVDITIKMIVLNLIITLLTTMALVFTPQWLISMILGAEFDSVKTLFWFLSPGILFLSISSTFSHYFAGLGLYRYNLWVSGIGVVLSIILSIMLIPILDLIGAAIATSCVFLLQLIILTIMFKRIAQISWTIFFNKVFKAFFNFKLLLNKSD